jgi:hypothetical protein
MYMYILRASCLTSDTNADKESPGSQHVEHPNGLPVPVGSSCQSGENDKDNSRHHQRVGARPVISEETKDELSDNRSDKGDVRNELEGG